MSFWSALLGAGASIWGSLQNNRNIDKQLAAQSRENAMTREHNLQLAKLQNQWNIAQWNNENAYNSPAAQMQRMKAAGLNPDMMYGGGVSGNLSASSPSMTSGAPATPMDWSALGSKKTVGDVALESAQIANINAQTEKVKSETEGQNIANEFAPLEKELGLQLTQSVIDKNRQELVESSERIKKYQSEIRSIDADVALKALDKEFNEKTMEARVRQVAAQANISESEAKVAMKSIMYKITMAEWNAEEAKAKALLAEMQKDAVLAKIVLDCINTGINGIELILDIKNGKGLAQLLGKHGKGRVGDASGSAGN